MKAFLDEDFLLSNETAKELYRYANALPIVDYHCHISPKEIAEDVRFENITQLWLSGDHYKWRLMRANGVKENYITGDAPDREKFQCWAETLEKAVGNPLYHWSHLELKRYFGYDGVLNGETAQQVWELTCQRLKDPALSARGLIRASNVAVICTTDDPIDDLRWHKQIAAEKDFAVKVLPAFRPDRAISIEKADFPDYLRQLGETSSVKINSFTDWKEALLRRLDYFTANGCAVTDHGLLAFPFVPYRESEIDAILKKRLRGLELTLLEEKKFKTACMLFLGRCYKEKGLVMQLHFGVVRNVNQRRFLELGPDTGYDTIYSGADLLELTLFLDALDRDNQLPKTILYSLDPKDNTALSALIGCFQQGEGPGKIQHGAAWWFNDNRYGILEQLKTVASQGLLGNFIGMLTDSRSFLSYTRHEYFRRILCDYLGTLAENGEYPCDLAQLKKLVYGICYQNAMEYFRF